MGVAKHTVQAAIERRDRDADPDDTEQQAQHWVSQRLYEKADREDRDPGEAPGTL